MKITRVLLAVLLPGLAIALLGCGSAAKEVKAENQLATVQRGNVSVDITAAGNLALSHTEDLPVDLFYPQGVKGTIGEVLVQEGDAVTAGQLLVTLDRDEWNDQLGALEDQVTAQERNLSQAQINLQTARQTLQTARDNQTAKELALFNAQISLDTANYNLEVAEKTYTWPDIQTAESDVNKAKAFLQYALDGQSTSGGDSWDRLVTLAQAQLDAAQKVYDSLVQGYDTEQVAIKKKQVASAQMSLDAAQRDLDNVAQDIATKEQQVTLNEGKLADAQKALASARKKLADAQGKSPEIKAPFDGFITKVNVAGGDEVLNGTVAVQLADPHKFEADILVSEMDIMQVSVGGEARVQVAALPGQNIPATVTHVSPTATIQSGVVNYNVTVEVQPLDTAVPEGQQAPGASAGTASRQGQGTFSQRQSGVGTAPGRATAAVSENFQLREGLTVTVSIIVQQKTDVLLVPNTAITTKGSQTSVQVVTPGGNNEQRVIQIGISDWQNTEVTSGLDAGEKVVVPQNTAPTTTTSQGPPPGGIVPNIRMIR